jgi:hypothetical protein
MSKSLTIKDIACILLHTKPFQTGDELREWTNVKESFLEVIKELYPNDPELIEQFKKFVEDE